MPVLIQYPEATAHLRHLSHIQHPSASITSVLSIKVLLMHYALQPLRNGKLRKNTVCVDDSKMLTCLSKGVVYLAAVVDSIPLRSGVVHRGELSSRGCWSLGDYGNTFLVVNIPLKDCGSSDGNG